MLFRSQKNRETWRAIGRSAGPEVKNLTPDIAAYDDSIDPVWRPICDWLAGEIAHGLPGAEAKIWHRAPEWSLSGNPITGYFPRKAGGQLLFWSGQSFDEPGLAPNGMFKAAEVILR